MAQLAKRWWMFSFRDWFRKLAHKKSSDTWLGVFSALESIIFPIPVEAFLWPLVGMRPNKWKYYVALATVSSVAGALIGYFIGLELWSLVGEGIIRTYGLVNEMESVKMFLDKNVFTAVFVGAFSPIPFKVFTLSAGAVGAPLWPFFFASLIGRTLRYGIAGWAISVFGERMGYVLFRYMNIILWIAIVVSIGMLVFLL